MAILTTGSLIIASSNVGKVREFSRKFAPLGITVRSMADFPPLPAIAEDGATFMDNAEIKARAVAEALGRPALADDSGLCVDRLGGAPGVYSARFAGEHATDAHNVEKLLQTLSALPVKSSAASVRLTLPSGTRILSSAKFVCALALLDPHTDVWMRAEGSCSGFIIDSPRGSGGFGYDPVFFLPEFGRTMAELTLEEKQSISHRGKALAQLLSQFSP